jgi:hypothetical protein
VHVSPVSVNIGSRSGSDDTLDILFKLKYVAHLTFRLELDEVGLLGAKSRVAMHVLFTHFM